jgi:hypothetical protein
VHRILKLRENVVSVAVVTLVKESSPDNSASSSSLLHAQSQCRDTYQLYLEDASRRVAVEFVLAENKKDQYCAGVVIGLRGVVGADGVLSVDRIHHPATPTVVAVVDNNNNKPKQQEHDAHLLLISGLDCGSAEMSSLPNDMLISFLQGSLGAVQ